MTLSNEVWRSVALAALVLAVPVRAQDPIDLKNINVKRGRSRTFAGDDLSVRHDIKDDGTLSFNYIFTAVGRKVVVGNRRKTDASFFLDQSTLFVPSNTTVIGNIGKARVVGSNSSFYLRETTVGNLTGSSGEWIVQDATARIFGDLFIGRESYSTGAVAVLRGEFGVLGGVLRIGHRGIGALLTSNTLVLVDRILVGSELGGRGDYRFDGGKSRVSGNLEIASGDTAIASVEIASGNFQVSGITVGPDLAVSPMEYASIGMLTVDDGTVLVNGTLRLNGYAPGNIATFRMNGGSFQAYSIECRYFGRKDINISKGTLNCSYIYISDNSTYQQFGGSVTAEYFSVLGNVSSNAAAEILGGDLHVRDITIGGAMPGRMTISNASVNALSLSMSGGEVLLCGGSLMASSTFRVGNDLATSPSILWVTGGELIVPGDLLIGFPSAGLVVVSNGTVVASELAIGAAGTNQSGFRIEGGTVEIGRDIRLFNSPGPAPHTISFAVNGGRLIATNGLLRIGEVFGGELEVNGGIVSAAILEIGTYYGDGTLTINGGAVDCGAINLGGPGSLFLNGGGIECVGDMAVSAGARARLALRSYSGVALNIAGTASLDGELHLAFADGFGSTVTNGSSVVLLNAGSLTGRFANAANGARLATDDGAGDFLVNYNARKLWLSDYRPLP